MNMSELKTLNDIQEIIVELYKSLYEITSEYIQRYHVIDEYNRAKYIDYLSNLTRKIKFYQTASKQNIYYKSDLSDVHINRIKSLL